MTATHDKTATSPYLDSLAWLYRQSRGEAPRDPVRMERLIDALGLEMPAKSAHVVGTNGKGTVTAMTAAAASAAGHRSGCFISPHVEDFVERISVDGTPIEPAQVVTFVDRVRTVVLPVVPSFFELCLAMALDHFRREGVTFAAVEAGVGARRDATAVLGNVAVTAVTPISLDHVSTLGPGLCDIARDKAAAIRAGAPVASAPQVPQVLAVLRGEAEERGATLHADEPGNQLFTLPPHLPQHADPVRVCNSRLAAAVVRLLGDVPEEALEAGLSIAPLPGRGERFRVGDVEVLLDGAHDPAAGAALAERAGREYVLLFGSLGRKQGEETLRALEGRATIVFVTSAGGEPITVRATATRNFVADPGDALRAALASCRTGALLVIGGSLYLAGELRPLLRDLAARDLEPATARSTPEDR